MGRTTTDPNNWGFRFGISDLGRYLGKSPVTLRGWERKGLVSIPREGSDRKLNIQDIRTIAHIARDHKRITQSRLNLINASLTLLEMVEQENSR